MRRRAFLALMALAGCEATDSPQLPQLTIAASASYMDFARAMKAASPMPAEILDTHDGPESLEQVASGKAHVGFAEADACYLAVQGEDIKRALPIKALAGLTEGYLQVAVSEERIPFPGRDLSVLKNRKVFAPSLVADRVIRASGVDMVRQQSSDPAEALRSGEIDAIFHTGGLPSPMLNDIGVPIALLPVPYATALYEGYGPIYLSRSIRAGIYQLKKEVPTIGIPNVLFARADVEEKAAYQLTELLFRSSPQLDRRLAAAALGVALHPGAERYYRESKPFLA